MARRRTPDRTVKPRPELLRPLGEAHDLLAEQIQRGSALLQKDIQSREDLASVRKAFSTWEEYNEELLRRLFTTDELSEEFGAAVRLMYSLGPSSLGEDVGEFRSDGASRLRRLESIGERLPLYSTDTSAPAATRKTGLERVFIVHGRDHGPRDAIRNYLRDLEIAALVLEDQPNQGRTIIEKFEANVDVSFAIIVLTPDDLGAEIDKADEATPRARQNVVLELGFFIGLLGRGRVAPVKVGELEVPGDVDGIVYIDFDKGGAWKLHLAKELKAAGFAVDLNRAV